MDIIDTNTAESRRRRALDTIDDRFIGTTNLNTRLALGTDKMHIRRRPYYLVT